MSSLTGKKYNSLHISRKLTPWPGRQTPNVCPFGAQRKIYVPVRVPYLQPSTLMAAHIILTFRMQTAFIKGASNLCTHSNNKVSL